MRIVDPYAGELVGHELASSRSATVALGQPPMMNSLWRKHKRYSEIINRRDVPEVAIQAGVIARERDTDAGR
jgi:hypothetical protein